MTQAFTCKKCGERSAVRSITQAGGREVVICERCGAKNSLIRLPTPQGDPARYEAVGIFED
jgi:transcription elongation factor Elf1